MRILSIETSCDDTGIAVVEANGGFSNSKFKVIESLVSSQIKTHRPFGGVVPGLAKREHIRNLPILLKKLEQKFKIYDLGFKNKKLINHKSSFLNHVDIIAVTVGPGLEPALWAGITFGQELSEKTGKPLIGVNHLEGHLYSFLLPKKTENPKRQKTKSKQRLEFENRNLLFPAIALLVSGGHTAILLMKNLKEWKLLGETRDDAAGEAFDKVARMLKLPYPGGPEIEKLAKKGNPMAIDFPKPMLYQKNYDFSFSGLKTSVLYHLRGQNTLINADKNADKRGYIKIGVNPRGNLRKSAFAADIAASFQKAVIDVLTIKTMRAAKEHKARSVILCGGVAANKELKKNIEQEAKKMRISFFMPETEYINDNGAMIAAAGYFAYLKGKKSARPARFALRSKAGGNGSRPVRQAGASGGLPMEANGSLNI
ncbi:MAG TPA: tRNA (adenosine(37)-N6)-threonylcarbamoyltransferase complex transferase subunit TsaD [Candidatus Paceibacterota bacterium]|nr:tRNA (adenosine(37)-N6)-threonylcarbamoyltransferase complex transferase subunit TsaD [Candidatus Paceibacterota bacterium]